MESKYKRNKKDYLETKWDGEMVFMNIHTAQYCGMNTTATHIWEILKTPMNLDTVVCRLMDVYDVSYERCKSDIEPLLQDMLENKFLTIQ